MRMTNTVKLNGVNPDIIKLQLFPFSLRDATGSWFESMPYGSVDSWEELVEAFMERFFPSDLTSERRREIISFKQGEEESLYNGWERYKKLLKRCLMHGIDQITKIDIFYHAMNYSSKGIIGAACYGAFKRKSTEEANQLIEDLAKSNYRAPAETSGSSSRLKGEGMLEMNKMTAIEAKLDVLMSRMNTQERRSHLKNTVGIEERGEKKCINDEGITHEGPYQVEEAQFVSGNRSYNF